MKLKFWKLQIIYTKNKYACFNLIFYYKLGTSIHLLFNYTDFLMLHVMKELPTSWEF